MSRLLTATSVMLTLVGFLTLAVDARTDDPPPAEQKSSKPKTDDPPPAEQDSSKPKTDDPTPTKKKRSKSKTNDPTPAEQDSSKPKTEDPPADEPKGTKTNTDDPSATPTVGEDKPDDSPSATPKGDENKTDDPPPPAAPEGVEVQTRGPVHEAYAEPSGSPPVANPVIPQAPPAPIEERARPEASGPELRLDSRLLELR